MYTYVPSLAHGVAEQKVRLERLFRDSNSIVMHYTDVRKMCLSKEGLGEIY